VLRNGVMIDDEGNEVDFCTTVVIFGSDCGNKHGLAHVAGHGGEIDSAAEADGGQVIQLIKKIIYLMMDICFYFPSF